MPPKEDPQAGQFDHDWGSRKVLKLIETMRDNDEARKAYDTAAKDFKELFAGHVEDSGLTAGTRVRMGKYVTTVTERSGGGTETKTWHSIGRSQIKLLEPSAVE